MSMLELSDLMHTNSTEKGRFVARCGRYVIRGHRVSCCKVREPLVLNQSCGRESLKTSVIKMGNGSV